MSDLFIGKLKIKIEKGGVKNHELVGNAKQIIEIMKMQQGVSQE
jgi:hypothetical protein